jgi:SAM-dependent methyltransferase
VCRRAGVRGRASPGYSGAVPGYPCPRRIGQHVLGREGVVAVSWEAAGEAWGARASDWASLIDPWSMPVYLDVFDRLGISEGDDVLDIGCGSALTGVELRRRGARPFGLDASDGLLDVARERSPEADYRLGDISELPWADDSFDVVVSFNGIWGLEKPMSEARRVLRDGGRFGISFWGIDRMDLMNSFVIALLESAPPEPPGEDLLAISQPGAAEAMIKNAGMTPVERGMTRSAQEFPDVDAGGALCAPGTRPTDARAGRKVRELSRRAIHLTGTTDTPRKEPDDVDKR